MSHKHTDTVAISLESSKVALCASGFATRIKAYAELCKFRVVLLMLLTALVGMLLSQPGWVPMQPLVLGLLGIGMASSAAAVVNHVVEQSIDVRMRRTEGRPLPTGRVTSREALLVACSLCALSMVILTTWVNGLCAILTFITMVVYAVIYTMFLKPATPQNIVIGGIAGAAPPMLGWVAITGSIDPNSLLLVLIIFLWTPPHFWALAIHRLADYEKSTLPMLPVTHGVDFTKQHILLYTVLLCAATVFPFAVEMSGVIYLAGAMVLNAGFLFHVAKLFSGRDEKAAIKTFCFSISYLFLLFIVLLIDHYLRF